MDSSFDSCCKIFSSFYHKNKKNQDNSHHKFLIGNGISNKDYREMKEKLNMDAQTTTDESLFSKLNGRKALI